MNRKLTALLLVLTGVFFSRGVFGQFTYSTNNSSITVSGYTGPGGAVDIPEIITGLPVRGIGARAFFYNETITRVGIPGGVTSIGSEAFKICTALTNVTLPAGLTYIGDSAFASCHNLTGIRIPSGLTTLDDSAFGNCVSLTEIVIPGSVGHIGIAAFSGCSGLTNVTIETGVWYIDLAAFYWCASLSSITIPKTVGILDGEVFYGCSNLKRVFFAGNAPSLPGLNPPFDALSNPTIYYLPETTGWSAMFGGRPTQEWNPTPQAAGVSSNGFRSRITGTPWIPLVIEATAVPDLSGWVPVQACDLTNGSMYFTDRGWTNYAWRLYRVRSP